MTQSTILAQATLAQNSEYMTSQFMGKIAGVLILAVLVIWIVQKVRGKK